MSNIVIIDDCKSILLCMKHIFEDKGHVVTVFKNPLKAIDDIEHLNPDLVITDYMMLDQDGLEVISELRKKGINCKYALFTSLNDPELIKICNKNDITFFNKQLTKDRILEDFKCLL